jgi:predicted  nucleic acid-binding Zn-ribbon protein
MRSIITLVFFLSLTGFAGVALAASAEDFKAAYDKAEAAEKEAKALKNQWSPTESALKTAKAAADAGKFDDAVKQAQHAEALAKASVAQAKEQETAWTQAVVH